MEAILQSLRLEEYQGLHHFIAAPQLFSLEVAKAPGIQGISINSTPTIGFRAFIPPQNIESSNDIASNEVSLDI